MLAAISMITAVICYDMCYIIGVGEMAGIVHLKPAVSLGFQNICPL